MAIYKFTIPTSPTRKMPALNDFIRAERCTFRSYGNKLMTKGSLMKKEWQQYISVYIRKDLGRAKVLHPIVVHYHYYEPDRKRDLGNVHATCQKFTEDALQDCRVIPNDNQKWIVGFTADFDIDRQNPRIEVTLEEVEGRETK